VISKIKILKERIEILNRKIDSGSVNIDSNPEKRVNHPVFFLLT
jgi:hypothetical protein